MSKFFTPVLVLLCMAFSPEVRALELNTSAAALHIVEASYHHLSYGAGLRFDLRETKLAVQVGGTHPYVANGFRQGIYHANVSWEWHDETGFFRPFAGIGGGVFFDLVGTGDSNEVSAIPAVVFRGGMKMGGKNFGFITTLEDYTGIYNLGQLPFTIWSLYNFHLGVYIAI